VSKPEPIDKVDIQSISDNITDNPSLAPRCVETEFAALERRRQGKSVLGGGLWRHL